MTASPRYGRERVRKGVIHFLFGKGLSAVTGVLILLLLVRELSVPEFAVYSVLVGFVEVLSAVAGLGLAQTVQRYVPELYAQHANRAFRGLVISTFWVRLATLSVAVGIVYLYSPELAVFFNAGEWIKVFQAYLGVVWLRATNQFLFQLLESTLHQKLGQGAFVLSSFLRLAVLLWVVFLYDLTLPNLILIELLSELVCLLILAVGVVRVLLAATPQPGEESFSAWWGRNAKRLTRFSIMAYLQHLAILPGTGSVNRLIAGGYLPLVSIAAYGVAESVAGMINRYLPAQFFAGLLRPVLVSRFAERSDFGQVNHVLDVIFRVNFLLIGWLGVLMLAVGADGLNFVTGKHYGQEVSNLLLLMLAILAFETQRQLLGLALQIVERYEVLIFGNLLLSASVFLALFLVGYMGAYAIPFASLTTLVLSNLMIRVYLGHYGYPCRFNMRSNSILLIFLGGGTAFALGEVSPWWVAGLITAVIYPFLAYKFGIFNREEISQLRLLSAKP